MPTLVSRQRVSLSAANPVVQFPPQPVSPLTAELAVSLQRPTTLTPLAWDDASTLRVILTLHVDGEAYRVIGQATGGIRLKRTRRGGLVEAAEYRLRYRLPVMLGERGRAYMRTVTPDAEGWYDHVPLTRVGELGTVVLASLRLEWVQGAIDTDVVLAESIEAPAPTVRTKNSVAFDAATDAQEVSGDGVLSLTHTSSGTNRAVFAGSSNSSGAAQLSTGTTYAGSAMTEAWDFIYSVQGGNAGYRLAGQSTGAQTVTNTLAGVTDEHFLGVISMTGVDQTTPVGAAATASGSASPATVTVSGTTADGMVVDNLYHDFDGAVTVGADQTQRNTETASGRMHQSTQPASAGGVMSWTLGGSSRFGTGWGIGAIEFKAAAAGGAFTIDAAPGSYSITGAAASIVAGRMVNAAPGSYGLTGVAATLLATRLISADPGSYVLTGAQAAILVERVLSADPGTYLVTGIAADLVWGGAGFSLNAEPGTYTVVGADAGLLVERVLRADPGAYLVVGAGAILVWSGEQEVSLALVPTAVTNSAGFIAEVGALAQFASVVRAPISFAAKVKP